MAKKNPFIEKLSLCEDTDDTEIWKVNEVSMKNIHQHINFIMSKMNGFFVEVYFAI